MAAFHACPRKYYLGYFLGMETAATAPFGDGDSRLPAIDLGLEVHKILAGGAEGSPAAMVLAESFSSSELGQRAARANIELDIWSLLPDRRRERSGETDRRSVIHRDCEAALRCFRIERGSTIERRMEVLQRRPDGTDKPFCIGCRCHAVRRSHEQIAAQGAS